MTLTFAEPFAERNLKLNTKVRTYTKVQLNFGLSLYLDRKFGLNLSHSEITLLFDLSLYLDWTLAQRKAKSKVKVAQCIYCWQKNCRSAFPVLFIDMTSSFWRHIEVVGWRSGVALGDESHDVVTRLFERTCSGAVPQGCLKLQQLTHEVEVGRHDGTPRLDEAKGVEHRQVWPGHYVSNG